MSYRGETIRKGISFGSALTMVIKSGWRHNLHPETRRIIKRVPRELVKVDSEDLSGGPTNMPQMSGEK